MTAAEIFLSCGALQNRRGHGRGLPEVPEEYINMPFLKRRVVYMKAKIKDNPNLQDCVFHIVVDGYNAPVTAGNFVDLAERNFYNGMEIQKYFLQLMGFVVQTRDPDGHAEGFIDPTTESKGRFLLRLW
ncbi:unnamed protein product [Brassica napus]|uniref:peptidylprolyl isomerase n=1 Tax=Brassica napus TaxID=3708 RepID=A0A816PAC1_BRANA|nr:unnamed protein product [Brassica napus]